MKAAQVSSYVVCLGFAVLLAGCSSSPKTEWEGLWTRQPAPPQRFDGAVTAWRSIEFFSKTHVNAVLGDGTAFVKGYNFLGGDRVAIDGQRCIYKIEGDRLTLSGSLGEATFVRTPK
jgi:hypothetical protein